MRKFKTYGGRLFALLFVLCTVFSSITVSASSNAWEQWQSVIPEESVSNENLLMSVRNVFNIELWHYSGGYWGNNHVKIYDSQVFDGFRRLAPDNICYCPKRLFEKSATQKAIIAVSENRALRV